ncbi:MAG: hypothetical protein WCG55_02465 [bacterium]
MEPTEKKPIMDENYTSSHNGHIAPIRTFSSDLAEAVREHGGSVVRVAIEEEEKHKQEVEDMSIRSRSNMLFVVGGFIVVISAIILFSLIYSNKKAAIVAPTVTQPTIPSSLITSENADIISVSGIQTQDVVAKIQHIAVNPKIQSGQVDNIILSNDGTANPNTRVPASAFLSLIGTHAPTSFLQSLLPDYMVGSVFSDHGSLFLVIHGTAHDYLLSGMLSWEPYLFNDMKALFALDQSTFTTAQLESLPFQDTLIENREARAVLDVNQKPLFYYTFLDTNTVLFAKDTTIMTEVVSRFH